MARVFTRQIKVPDTGHCDKSGTVTFRAADGRHTGSPNLWSKTLCCLCADSTINQLVMSLSTCSCLRLVFTVFGNVLRPDEG